MQAERTASAITAKEAVKMLFTFLQPGTIISTRSMIEQIRFAAPHSDKSDEEIVALIVTAATGRQLAVQFDHAGAA